MDLATLLTPNGLIEAIKAHHKNLHQNHNFPPLNGMKPIHKFAELFGLDNAEQLAARLAALTTPPPENVDVYICTRNITDDVHTYAKSSYQEALESFHEELISDVYNLGTPEEFLEHLEVEYCDTDNIDDLVENAIKQLNEEAISKLHSFFHGRDAFIKINKASIQKTETPTLPPARAVFDCIKRIMDDVCLHGLSYQTDDIRTLKALLEKHNINLIDNLYGLSVMAINKEKELYKVSLTGAPEHYGPVSKFFISDAAAYSFACSVSELTGMNIEHAAPKT
jgi:hypothetical protein